jgi:hypothetical protein
MRKTILLLLLLPVAGCSNDAGKDPSDAETSSTAPATGGGASAGYASKPPAPAARAIAVPAGTPLNIILADALSSGKNHAGDRFSAQMAEALVVDGKTVIPKGAAVQGTVVSAEESARVKGLANMSLALTEVTVGGKQVPISTQVLAQEADSSKGRDAAIIGGAAGIGTAIGALAGGKKGAATGAAVGGGAGVGTVLATKGKEVEYPVETKLSFTVAKDFSVMP